MTRQLNMAGRNSNEIYTLLYPNNLINFCKYDFTPFLNHCTDLCRLANRTGEFNVEDVYAIRNSISGCHKYYEQNMRTVFEKIVVDCWIDYLGKQSEASVSALWQSFMRCKNDFEKAVFARLSEYRHNRAINEWTNLLKLQEYARVKTDFIFGVKLRSVSEANARANYFDLMYNVAANEQGFSVSDIGGSCVFSVGRVPNSPFILSSASREILRNVLNNMEDAGARNRRKPSPELSDLTAMEAFDAVKNYIPNKNDSLVGTIIKSISGAAQRVYLPCSFKAIIDLEIDATIESGGYLQICPRCGEYFLKDADYPYDFCSRTQKDGTVCLDLADSEISVMKAPEPPAVQTEEDEQRPIRPLDKDYVNDKLDALYKEMSTRVNVDMTQRDFSRWYQRELRLKELILLGKAGEDELEKFIQLSRGDEFASKKQPPLFEKRPEPEEEPIAVTESGKEVKKFVFERVERAAEQSRDTLAASEQAANEAIQRLFAARRGDAQPQPVQPAQQSQAAQQSQPAQQPQQAVPQPRQPYYSQQPYQYPKPNQQYPQQPYQQQKPVTRIIRGGAPTPGYTERPFDVRPKPKTVVIPNGEGVEKPARGEPLRTDEDVKLYRDEDDVKIFTPHHTAAEPYETQQPFGKKIKLPLDEYRKGRADERERGSDIPDRPEFSNYIEPSPYEPPSYDEQPEPEPAAQEVQIEGQISADEVAVPAPSPTLPSGVSAKALSAYRTLSIPKITPSDEKKLEKADFSGILEGMNRSDGFRSDDEELDSDGMPVSHKTAHVMNALFSQPRVSPFLRINLDDDDDG